MTPERINGSAASAMSGWTLVTRERNSGIPGGPGPEELNSPEFKAELQQVVDELRTSVLKDLSSYEQILLEHGGEVGNWPSNYG